MQRHVAWGKPAPNGFGDHPWSMYGERGSGFSVPNAALGQSNLNAANAYSREIQRKRDERKFVDPTDITDYSQPYVPDAPEPEEPAAAPDAGDQKTELQEIVDRLNRGMKGLESEHWTKEEIASSERGTEVVDFDVIGAASIAKAFLKGIVVSISAALWQKVAESGIWKLGPVVRGEIIEKALGQNLHKNFPVIDKLLDGVATSIKSINLLSLTYQNGTKLGSTLKRYVDKVAAFEGKDFSGQSITYGVDFTKRALELAIPGRGTKLQQQIIQHALDYAKTKGVDLKVILFP